MTQLKKSSIITKYNDASTGKFRTGQTRGIGSDDYRELMVDLIDSLVSNVDDFQKLTTATGTDTYLIAGGISSYVTGFAVAVLFTNANTGASTLNVNSLGAKAIKKSGTTALSSGDIAAGQIILLVYDGTNFQAIGIGSGGGGGSGIVDQTFTADATVDVDGNILVIQGSEGTIGLEVNESVPGDTEVLLGVFGATPGGRFFADSTGAKIKAGSDPSENDIFRVNASGYLEAYALGLKLNSRIKFYAVSGSYTLNANGDDLNDINAGENLLIEINSNSANDLTIPLNASVAFPVGTQILFKILGTGVTTFQPATGAVTLTGSAGDLVSHGQYSLIAAIKRATNTWFIENGSAISGGSGDWGDIGGTITDQTDLVSYVAGIADAKVIDSIADSDTTHAPSRNSVFDALALKAPLASPTLTGTPEAPTAAGGTSTTQIATTAFVVTEVGTVGAASKVYASQTFK